MYVTICLFRSRLHEGGLALAEHDPPKWPPPESADPNTKGRLNGSPCARLSLRTHSCWSRVERKEGRGSRRRAGGAGKVAVWCDTPGSDRLHRMTRWIVTLAGSEVNLDQLVGFTAMPIFISCHDLIVLAMLQGI